MSAARRVLAFLIVLLALVAVPAAVSICTPALAAATGHCKRTLPSYPVLHPGDRGRAVRTLQCSLNDLGKGPIVVDGFYGPQTKAAVKKIVDGFEGQPAHPYRINNGFWVLLFGRQVPNSDLELGTHGPAITVLQRALRAAGATVTVNGRFDDETETAVLAYQKANHVKQTGVVDENTRFYLYMGGVIGHLN